jgi:hypothetical protein
MTLIGRRGDFSVPKETPPMPITAREPDDKDWKPSKQPAASQSRDISKQIEKAQRERPNPSR